MRQGIGVGRRKRLPHFSVFGFQALQFFERAVVDALAGIGDPLEALKGGGIGGEGVAGGAFQGDFDILYQEGSVGSAPEVGFDAAHAAEAPFIVYKGVDEEALVGIGWVVMFVVLGGKLGEIFGFFVEHDLVNGEDAVLQGVEAGLGLACGGAGAGRFLRVGAAGFLLFES